MRALVVLALVAAARAASVPAPIMQSPESAELCGSCHRAIHEAWKNSAHARSMDSRLFQDALELAIQEIGPDTRKICLGCHAPVAARIGDFGLSRKVSWEGVTCDYCHSIQEVSLSGPNPSARVQFSLVKSGPLKDATSSGHGTVYSAVHTTSATCAPCHEYRNPLGFPVLTTYSEWKQSRAAREGKDCQSCHMDRVAGDVVDPRILRTRDAKVNLHQMAGSHSLDQLTRTIGGALSAVREGSQLKVTVDVTNRMAGHSVPTGSALRELVLDVTADCYNGQRFHEERVYHRVLMDQEENTIRREHFAMLRAAKVQADTRLAADEKRTETFYFPVPAGVQSAVKATFTYYYSPMARTEAQQRVTFLTLQRLVK